MSVALLTAARDAALAALDAGNYAAAKKQGAKALAILATVPDSDIAGVSSQSWDRKAINDFIAAVKEVEKTEAAEAEGCGFTVCEIEYTGTRGGCSC